MRPIGVDAHGRILTEVALEKIPPEFAPIVAEVTMVLLDAFGDALTSIYLYGSVVTGRARVKSSDLDVLLIFADTPSMARRGQIERTAYDLGRRNDASLREVGLAVASRADLSSPAESHGLLCFVKHLCVLIHGEDLAWGVPAFEPTVEVARGFNGDIATELRDYRVKLGHAADESTVHRLSRSVAKKIVRTGFSLVMPCAGSWTTDLRASRNAFVEYYPDRSPEMDRVLTMAERGADDASSVIDVIDGFGSWLIDEFDRIIGLKPSSPNES